MPEAEVVELPGVTELVDNNIAEMLFVEHLLGSCEIGA